MKWAVLIWWLLCVFAFIGVMAVFAVIWVWLLYRDMAKASDSNFEL